MVERLFCYERPRDGQRVEIFRSERRGEAVYVIREGNGHDSMETDKAVVDSFRASLREQGFLPRRERTLAR
ncbi:MAG: hypothetical protein JOZ39_10610 [Chloroflexi bacterium]|nr:hypothetical protein [Chloroflexota bacterium]